MVLLFSRDDLLLGSGPTRFPTAREVDLPASPLFIGRHSAQRYFALYLENPGAVGFEATYGWVNRRGAHRALSSEAFWISARGYQLARWDRESRYCGRCGKPMERAAEEVAKVCAACGHREYPRIAPAMIVAVVSRGRLLMAHARKHREGLYSVLAGFVEPGESLEACVIREVREETNVELGEVRYFASQSWPFPYSLMVAFTAEAVTEEITIEEEEIGEAGWFTPEELLELPEIPGRLSVSRRLIDWFMDSYGSPEEREKHHRRQ